MAFRFSACLAGIMMGFSGLSFAADTVPASHIVTNTQQFQSVRLIAPTDRYDHCVLGDCIEAGGVEVILQSGQTSRFLLNSASVFEDLRPRVVPLGHDGGDAILLVRAYANAGGALALLEMVDGDLRISAEGPAIGMANRWQNPVGVADFDGDGRLEVATVITPHIGGTLALYERQGDRLVRDHEIYGFSNHAIGSENLGLSVIMDVNGDDIPDIILPDRRRKNLMAVDFSKSDPKIIGSMAMDISLDQEFSIISSTEISIGETKITLDF